METAAITSSQAAVAATATERGFGSLSGDDFFMVMLTQLQNQDPLEPQKNEALLEQISTIRSMELSQTLTDAVSSLVEQQRFASSAALIGQYALGEVTDAQGEAESVQGIVVGLRFDKAGEAILELDSGEEVPLENVHEVMSPSSAAESMIGLEVWGAVPQTGGESAAVQGTVDSVRFDEYEHPILVLDTGEELPLRYLLGFKLSSEDDGGSS